MARATAVLMGATMAPVAALQLAPATASPDTTTTTARTSTTGGAGASSTTASGQSSVDLTCSWGGTTFATTVTTRSSVVDGSVRLQVSGLSVPEQEAGAQQQVAVTARAGAGDDTLTLQGSREYSTAVPLADVLELPVLLGEAGRPAVVPVLEAVTVQLTSGGDELPDTVECARPGAKPVAPVGDAEKSSGTQRAGAGVEASSTAHARGVGESSAEAATTGSVSGKVVLPAGVELEEAEATAHREYTDSWWDDEAEEEVTYSYWDWETSTSIRSDLTYSFPALQPGRYKFQFEEWRLASAWYGGATEETATVVEVVAGRALTGIDATLVRLGSISGTATLASGEPLDDERIFAIDLATGSWHSGWAWEGEFTIYGLMAGTYVLYFEGSGTTRSTYLGGDSEETATRFTLAQGQDRTGVVLTIAESGAIRGWLDPSARVSVVWVYAKNPSGGWDVVRQGDEWNYDDDSVGTSYFFGELDGGTYRVATRSFATSDDFWAAVPDGDLDVLTPERYWPSEDTLAAGWDVIVTEGEVVRADFAPSPYGSISGRVTVPAGLDASDVRVIARRYDAEDDYWYWSSESSVKSDGTYRVEDLDPGTYRLELRDDSGSYDSVYYPAAESVEDGQDVQVRAAEDTAGISMAFGALSTVSGRVQLPTGVRATDVSVALFGRYENSDGSVDTWREYTTDLSADGTFVFDGVRPGSYALGARTDAVASVWTILGGGNLAAAGTQVLVERDKNVSGLTLALASGSLSGRVLDPAGKAVPNAVVSFEVMRSDGKSSEWGGETYTDASGRWSLTGVAGGSYRVLAIPDTDTGLTWNWYGNARHLNQAPDIKVVGGQSRSGLDITVQKGGFITGTIQVSDLDQSREDLGVYAFRLEDGVWRLYEMWFPSIEGSSTPFASGLVHTGKYRFGVSRSWGEYPAAFVGGTSLANATTYTVTAGQTLSGLKLVLPAGAKELPEPTSPVTEPTVKPTPKPTATPTAKPVVKVVRLVKKPKVTGKARVGKTLKASKGSYKATDPKAKVRVKFQWQTKKGTKAVNVKKATKSKLKLTKKLRKKQVRVRITVTAPGHKTYVYSTKWSKKVA